MFMLILILSFGAMPKQAPTASLPPQAPANVVQCLCGDSCRGSQCDLCPCAEKEKGVNGHHAKPEGQGWSWNEREQCWQRTLSIINVRNGTVHSQPVISYTPQPQLMIAPTTFRGSGDCSSGG